MWRYMPVIPVFSRQRKEDQKSSKATLGYTARGCLKKIQGLGLGI
jgi:hypothetical protein